MILFVDDERRHISSYVSELEELGYRVVCENSVDQALQFLNNNRSNLKLIILDIMMPPGRSFKKMDTDEGRRTGVYFFEQVKERAPELPVIVLTNVSDDDVLDRLRDEENCWYFQKKDYLPYEIAQEVKRIYPLSL